MAHVVWQLERDAGLCLNYLSSIMGVSKRLCEKCALMRKQPPDPESHQNLQAQGSKGRSQDFPLSPQTLADR